MFMSRGAAVALFGFCAHFWFPAALGADWAEQDLSEAAALRDRALAGTAASEHVESLVTQVGPRFAGSPGDPAAVRWALDRMGRLGFTNVRSQDVLVPRWVRGSSEAILLSSTPQLLAATSIGGSVGTREEGLEASVLYVESFDALQALPANSAANKIVFIDQRTERTRDGSGYGRAVKARVQGPSIAAQLGAVALVIRSIGTSSERVPHTGALIYAMDAPRIPAFALAAPDADLLARHLKASKTVRMRLKSTARELPPVWSANVIGEIPGRDPANEIVLLGAHLDSWDLGQGALDDGAGVAIVLEAARLIGKVDRKPARTVRVVLFANEEFGLSGAHEYAKQVGDEVARHVIAMEADMGQGPVWRIQSQVASAATPAIASMHEILKPLNVELGSSDSAGGSDIGPLKALGVPGLELTLDGSLYFDVHHTANDTLLKVDAKILDQSVAAYAAAAYLAATKQGDFGRLPTKGGE
jgi:carboxypeptidase Q